MSNLVNVIALAPIGHDVQTVGWLVDVGACITAMIALSVRRHTLVALSAASVIAARPSASLPA